MELYQKILSFAGVCSLLFLTQTSTIADNIAAQDSKDQLVPGYSEQYTFKLDGAVIGGQSATLSQIANGLQTWVFTLNLAAPVDGKTVTYKQSGTFVVGADGHVISYDSISQTDGSPLAEKMTFGARAVSVDFDPNLPGVDHTFLTFGNPYLLINDLVTPLSLATRAEHENSVGGFLLPMFSGNYLHQVVVSFKPKTVSGWAGRHFNVYDGTLVVPGQPDSTFEYWLSPANGEIIRATSDSQKLEVIRNRQ